MSCVVDKKKCAVKILRQILMDCVDVCAMKNMQDDSYLWPNWRNFRVLKEIRVEEHDSVIRFYTGSGILL